jgi:hypothetical protein
MGTLGMNRRAPGPMTVTHDPTRTAITTNGPRSRLALLAFACGKPSCICPETDYPPLACDVVTNSNSLSLWYPSCRLSRSSRTTHL